MFDFLPEWIQSFIGWALMIVIGIFGFIWTTRSGNSKSNNSSSNKSNSENKENKQ